MKMHAVISLSRQRSIQNFNLTKKSYTSNQALAEKIAKKVFRKEKIGYFRI